MLASLPATLPDLLRRAAALQPACDDASRELIERSWSERPEAVCAVVRHAVDLEAELTLAQREVARLKQLLLQAGVPALPAGDAQAQRTAPSHRPPARLTFEDIGARFFANHAGKAWAALLLLAAITVLVKEGLV